MKGHPLIWSEDEIEIVKANYKSMYKKDICKLMNDTLGTSHNYSEIKCLFKKLGLTSGIDCTFKKGQVAHNKGVPMSKEIYEKCSKSMFKKGHTPHNTLPLKTEIWHKDKTGKDYLFVKVAEPNVWKLKHHLVWEEKNGSIPEGSILVFIDGDTNNICIENLRMISKAENLLVNNEFGGMELSFDERNIAIDIASLKVKIKERCKA